MQLRIWFFFMFCCAFFAQSQELTPVYETITEGLPSTEVHDIYQDSVGYMWFATDRGICKYDGDRMQIIEVESYLKTKCVFKFFKQKETKVWIVSGKKRLYWFNPHEAKPKFHGYKYNDKLETLLANSRFSRNISNIEFSGNKMFIFFRMAPGYILIERQNKPELIGTGNLDNLDNTRSIVECNLIVKNTSEYKYIQLALNEKKSTNNTYFIEYNEKKIEFPVFGALHNNYEIGISSVLKLNRNNEYIAISDILIERTNGRIKYIQLPSSILSLHKYGEALLVGTYNGIYVLNENLKVIDFYFENNSITKIFVDVNQQIWISTLQQGVITISNLREQSLSLSESIHVDVVLNLNNKLVIIDNVKRTAQIVEPNFSISRAYQNFYYSKSLIRFENKNLISILALDNRILWDSRFYIGRYFSYNVDYTKNENYWVGYTGLVKKINPNGSVDLFFSSNKPYVLNFCIQYSKEKLLVATNVGLYFLDISSKKISEKAIKNSEDLEFHEYFKLGKHIFFATSKGLFLFHRNEFRSVDKKLEENIIGMYKISENSGWFFSENRIFKLTFVHDKPTISELKYDFGKKNTVILDLVEFNHKLWVATKNGLFIMDPVNRAEKQTNKSFTFVLDSVQVKNKNISHRQGIEVFSEDNLQLFFSTISFDRTINRALEYSVDGKNWFETNKNSLLLGNLAFGKNTLLIRRIDDPSHIIFKMQIDVLKRYYQTTWFKLLTTIIGLFIIILIVNKILNVRENKKLKELEKLGLELKLLTSKMNPHFTFNTINSIQHFILKNDKKEAINYLSDFALLMRKSLDFSMEERITFQQERDFLALYIQLENKRFNTDFKFDFQVKDPIDLLVNKIPSMLIQPLIENVILHANYTPQDEKIIRIIVTLDKGFYSIKVIDFGVGMQESKKISLKKHKSYGLEILKSRVKLYNGDDFLEQHIQVESTDKVLKRGTTITIKLKEWTQ